MPLKQYVLPGVLASAGAAPDRIDIDVSAAVPISAQSPRRVSARARIRKYIPLSRLAGAGQRAAFLRQSHEMEQNPLYRGAR